MQDTSTATRRITWQSRGKRVTLLAEMAVRQRQVAQRLSQLREQHELTQEQAAQKVGITVRQWQRWEDGTSMPHARNLKLTADAFGVRVEDFFDEEEIGRIKGGVNGELDLRREIRELHRKLDILIEGLGLKPTTLEPTQEATEVVAAIERQHAETAPTATAKTKPPAARSPRA
jgi:transcriptional regulator with XRE-family HTH domain